MNKYISLVIRTAAFAVTIAAIALAGGRISVSADRAMTIDDFKVGDQVEATTSGLLEVESSYEACVITEILGNGYRLKCSGMEYVVQKAWVRRPQRAVKQPPVNAPAPPVRDDDDTPAPAGDCNITPPGPATTVTERFSASVAKREIYDNYKIGVRAGGVTSPLNIGVTFLTMQLGRSYTNTVTNGYRLNDAAPPNATLYHVRSKHIVCEQYRDRNLRREVESGYSCFKNRDNEWACGVDGVPKITQLQ